MGKFLKSVAGVLLFLNLCMYAVVLGIGGCAMNRAIDHGSAVVSFPMGNAATGFFVMFSLIAGAVGVASSISGLNHLWHWDADTLPAAASAATVAWTLTVAAMGFGCKEIFLENRNTRLKTMEAFIIILSATQLYYISAIHGVKDKDNKTLSTSTK